VALISAQRCGQWTLSVNGEIGGGWLLSALTTGLLQKFRCFELVSRTAWYTRREKTCPRPQTVVETTYHRARLANRAVFCKTDKYTEPEKHRQQKDRGYAEPLEYTQHERLDIGRGHEAASSVRSSGNR